MPQMVRSSRKGQSVELKLGTEVPAPAESNDVDRLRSLLAALRLSQRGAARLLGIGEQIFRRYCTGELAIPGWLFTRLRERADARYQWPT